MVKYQPHYWFEVRYVKGPDGKWRRWRKFAEFRDVMAFIRRVKPYDWHIEMWASKEVACRANWPKDDA